MRKINIEEVISFISSQGPNTKIYLGCDSFRYRRGNRWFASYTTVLVVHMNGRNGCRVFGEIDTEEDFTKNEKKSLQKPRMRLMNEVYKVAALYMQLSDILENYEVEIHLDINPDEKHGSSCVVSEAIGYIRGTCNVIPLVKPQSWAATHAADHFKSFA